MISVFPWNCFCWWFMIWVFDAWKIPEDKIVLMRRVFWVNTFILFKDDYLWDHNAVFRGRCSVRPLNAFLAKRKHFLLILKHSVLILVHMVFAHWWPKNKFPVWYHQLAGPSNFPCDHCINPPKKERNNGDNNFKRKDSIEILTVKSSIELHCTARKPTSELMLSSRKFIVLKKLES